MRLAVGRSLGILYAYNGVVESWYPEWLQGKLNVLIGLLRRYRLVENAVNTKAMACHPYTLRSGMLEEVVIQKCTVRGATYCEQLRRRTP